MLLMERLDFLGNRFSIVLLSTLPVVYPVADSLAKAVANVENTIVKARILDNNFFIGKPSFNYKPF